jgi:DNA-binding phage protein
MPRNPYHGGFCINSDYTRPDDDPAYIAEQLAVLEHNDRTRKTTRKRRPMTKHTSMPNMLKDMNVSQKFIKSLLNSTNERSLARTLFILRCKKSWTQEQIAKKLKWSKQKVSKFEVKKNDNMTIRDVIAYSHALGYRLSIKVAQLKGTK